MEVNRRKTWREIAKPHRNSTYTRFRLDSRKSGLLFAETLLGSVTCALSYFILYFKLKQIFFYIIDTLFYAVQNFLFAGDGRSQVFHGFQWWQVCEKSAYISLMNIYVFVA